MADEEQQDAPPQAAAAPPALSSSKFFKLPDFWTACPAAWFGVVEAQFTLRNVTSQADRFGLVTAVLPEPTARRIAHLLAAPSATCYDDIRAALMVAHQLTAFQKAERLFSNEQLGDRRPSELLSEMMEHVVPG